jgi:hypothetical protein
MEALLPLLVPVAVALAASLIARARTAARERTAARPAPVPDPKSAGYVPPTFRVVALGASGAGKTVFLASMFHKLNYQAPGRSYYLQSDAQQRVALGRIYSSVSDTARPWPPGTREGETREFVFDCVGVDDTNAQHTVLRMSYLDYAGELLEIEQESGRNALDDLARRIQDAHALLGMIDGYRVLQLLNNEPAGRDYFRHSLQPMFGFMQGASCPIHLVLTKWDLVRQFSGAANLDDAALLDRVIEALMSYEHIKALVYVHSKNRIVRLIPVSAVGPSFVELDRGKVIKRADGELRPTNVEVPLCAVLPDLFKQVELSLDQSVRRGINTDMLRQLRTDAGALAGSVLARPAGTALRVFLQAALGKDVGTEASRLFVEWLLRPSADQGRLRQIRNSFEQQLADLQRVRGLVMEDFKKTVVRLEALLPNSELSKAW